MRVVTNRVDVESVRTETEDGSEFLVAPVVLVRSMLLNGPAGQPDVYLPQQEVEASVGRWAGVVGPIDHPFDGEQPISVHDDRADTPIIAEIRDPEATESKGKRAVAGELWVDVEAATDAGSDGQRVVNRLRNGDAVEVSSAYAPGRIVSGQFDGEFRERAALDIQPDHVAILPNDKGRCSLADGCGAGAPVAPAANQIFVNLTDDPVSPESGPGEDTSSQTDRTDGMDDDQTPFERLGRKVAESLGIANVGGQPVDEPAESGTDDTTPSMGDKTTELVENHDFDAENLPDEDSECFDRIYNAFVDNDDGSGDGGDGGPDGTDDGTEAQTPTDDGGLDADDLLDRMEDRFVTTDDLSDAVSDAITANREHERKADIAEDIAANSDEYDGVEQVLDDFPTEAALRTKRESVTSDPVAIYAAQVGARDTRSSDADAFPSPIANERAKELEEGAD